MVHSSQAAVLKEFRVEKVGSRSSGLLRWPGSILSTGAVAAQWLDAVTQASMLLPFPIPLQTPAIVIAFLQPGPDGKPAQPGKDAQVRAAHPCF